MSRCRACERKQNRPAPHADRTRELADILIPALRHVAYRHGYALAVHGSLDYDIDLIAAPWRVLPTSVESLLEAIQKAIIAINGVSFHCDEPPTKKPCGRIAMSYHLGGGPYVDISVMPALPETPACGFCAKQPCTCDWSVAA